MIQTELEGKSSPPQITYEQYTVDIAMGDNDGTGDNECGVVLEDQYQLSKHQVYEINRNMYLLRHFSYLHFFQFIQHDIALGNNIMLIMVAVVTTV